MAGHSLQLGPNRGKPQWMKRVVSNLTATAAATRAVIALFLSVLLAVFVVTGCTVYRGARLYRSGTIALDQGEPARAIAELERAAQLVPAGSEIQNHLGLAYVAAGREDDAVVAFQRAIDLDCDNLAARENLSFFQASAASGPHEADNP